MNIQTEHIENHKVRLTVEVDPARWEKAKKQAARQLSKRYRIPGFRKGKAPYRIIERYLGKAPILESAVEELGNEIYRDALEQTKIEPYAPGSLEDFQSEPQPTYTFIVALRPEVELGDYRSIRLDYDKPEVTNEQVDEAMWQIQRQEALVEESTQPVAVGNRVTLDIHSEFVDGEAPPEIDDDALEDTDSDEDDAEESPHIPYKGEHFIHEHDATIDLDPEHEPVLPGFIDALVGSKIDEDVEFELIVPDEDDEDYKDIVGRKIHFHVTIKKVENVTLPELNDAFAARLTQDEDEPLTLLQLRMRVRENLQAEAEREADNQYSNQVLDAIVQQARIVYPDEMIADRIEDLLKDFDQSLRQEGIDLDTYQQVTGTTKEQLYEQHQPQAEASLQHTLTLSQILVEEGIRVSDEDVSNEVDNTLQQFGDHAEMFREYFDTTEQRSTIANNLLYQRLMDRLLKIGRGLPIDEADEAVAAEAAEGELAMSEEAAAEAEPAQESTTFTIETSDTNEEREISDSDESASDKATISENESVD